MLKDISRTSTQQLLKNTKLFGFGTAAAFAGVSQHDLEIELAHIADKHLWVSTFKSLTADLKDVARQKAILAQENKWSYIENLPQKTKKLISSS